MEPGLADRVNFVQASKIYAKYHAAVVSLDPTLGGLGGGAGAGGGTDR